jgi:ATP-dependent DNA ligase
LAKPLKKVGTIWVEPRFDAEITYAEITDDGVVRHPVFRALHDPSRSKRSVDDGRANVRNLGLAMPLSS